MAPNVIKNGKCNFETQKVNIPLLYRVAKLVVEMASRDLTQIIKFLITTHIDVFLVLSGTYYQCR